MTKYTFSVATDFTAGVQPTRLTAEITASSIVTPLDHIDTSGDVCDLWFDAALSGADETTLAAVVAAHDGTPAPAVEFVASSSLNGTTIMSPGWDDVDGVVSNPQFFANNLSLVLGRCIGLYKSDTVGGTPQLRVVERLGTDDTETVLSDPFDLADTAGVFKTFAFYTNVTPSEGQNQYILQGQLNGGASASVKFVSLSLLKKTGT